MILPIKNIYKFFTTARKLSVTANVVTLTVLAVSIATLGIFVSTYYAQRQLKNYVKLQSSVIPELIKAKEDGRDLSTALAQATSINNELRDLINTLRTTSTVTPIVTSVIVDGTNQTALGSPQTSVLSASNASPLLGMVQVNGVETEVKSVYASPQLGTTVTGSVPGSDLVFYIQKQPGWYQVELNSGSIGWIPEEQVTSIED